MLNEGIPTKGLYYFITDLWGKCAQTCYVTARDACVMYSAWKSKDNYDTSASVLVVHFNGFISLTSDFDGTYSY